jgi:C_GCAxxG_C_C family probable redox protein
MIDVEKAVGLFQEGFSCSQALRSTYGERYGLARDLALKLGDAFGGGMGGLGRMCGAVTGALMVIGLVRSAAEILEHVLEVRMSIGTWNLCHVPSVVRGARAEPKE